MGVGRPRGRKDTKPRKRCARANLQRDNEIRELRSQGATLQALGEQYGISRERIRQIVGPAPMACSVTMKSENDKFLLELYQGGLWDLEMARRSGFSLAQISLWRQRRGLPCNPSLNRFRKRPRPRLEFPERLELYKQGLSDRAIGRTLGVPGITIHKWRVRQGLPANYTQGGKNGGRRIL